MARYNGATALEVDDVGPTALDTTRWRQRSVAASLFAGLASLIIYALTCYRTITWWESSQYSLAACTLGVVGAPGSLMLTVLGRAFTRLPFGISPAFALNLLAGILAAGTIALTVRAACNLYGMVAPDKPLLGSWWIAVGIALGSLPLAFGSVFWTYAVMFTPYMLTAIFTATILVSLLRWWQAATNGIGWLFVIALLIGLDFSVHRTNALLIPGILAWVMIRRPRAIASLRVWAAGTAGLLAGLAAQLLIMPMASRSPALNMGNPSNWSRWWDYVSLKQTGGGFLFNVFPRRSGFFNHQLRDVMDALASSFTTTGGTLAWVGAVPLVFGVYGIVSLWKKNTRLAVALAVLFIATVCTTVVYFNIPTGYFRSLHRHYLPCLVIFALISGYGAGAAVARLRTPDGRRGIVLAGVTLGLIAAGGIGRLAGNYHSQDRSRSHFAYDFAHNLLDHIPRDSILLTNGDNDTFPLWYLQTVEGVRPDVTVINIPLTNTSWYVENVLCRPGGVAFSRPVGEMTGLHPIPWTEHEVALPGYLPAEGAAPADSVRLHVAPSMEGYLLAQDQVILEMIQTNRWKRPVMVATTVSPRSLSWLSDHLSLEGLAYHFVPAVDPGPAVAVLKSNLLERYRYRGYAEPATPIDATTRTMGQNYCVAFVVLAHAVRDGDGREPCLKIMDAMQAVLPLERLQPAEPVAAAVAGACTTP
ncbi:MAG TPA: DUF2723 domain-containing protein [Candidatus Krumholzibacteria bacterium]|nr:DUF2723 domain-containing protein [Candidatus Krumholzibacteria bacterium]